MTLDDATLAEVRHDYWGVGMLDRFVVVASMSVTSYDDEWKALSKRGRVMAHALERGADPDGHPADYIARAFANLTGKSLRSTETMDVEVKLFVTRPPAKSADPRTIDELGKIFEDAVTTPWPGPQDDWRTLTVSNQRSDIERMLGIAWTKEPARVVERWLPRAIAKLDELTAAERKVPASQFERIARGSDDGRMAALAPLYRTLRLTSDTKFRSRGFTSFFAHPIAPYLERLDFWCTGYPSQLAEIVAAADLGNVRYASFDRSDIGSPGLASLARASGLGSLRELDLNGCKLDANGLAALPGATFLPQLEMLRVGEHKLGPEIARTLGECHLPELRVLRLGDSTLAHADILDLVARPNMPALTSLDLYDLAADPLLLAALQAARPGVTYTFAR